jgi:hypothetical protein
MEIYKLSHCFFHTTALFWSTAQNVRGRVLVILFRNPEPTRDTKLAVCRSLMAHATLTNQEDATTTTTKSFEASFQACLERWNQSQ